MIFPTFNSRIFAALLALGCAWPVCADDDKKVDSWSRIVKHVNGTQTHSKRDAGKRLIVETTYDKDGVKQSRREFQLDSKDRTRNGIIYDAKDRPLGSTYYSYDTFDKLLEEQLFNAKGFLIRRLFYPGALKDPRNAKRSIAFLYDPADPDYNPKKLGRASIEDTDTRPVRPVQESDSEFTPGMPIGTTQGQLGANNKPIPDNQTNSTRPESSNTRAESRKKAARENEWQPGSTVKEETASGREAPKRTRSILPQLKKPTSGN